MARRAGATTIAKWRGMPERRASKAGAVLLWAIRALGITAARCYVAGS